VTDVADDEQPAEEPPDEDAEPEKPDVGADQRVDVDLEAVDKSIEEDDEGNESDGSGDSGGDSEPDADEDAYKATTDPSGYNLGDAYVKGLTTACNTAVNRYCEDPDPVDADLARELELDQAINDWLATKDMNDEMSPGQAVLVSTLLFVGLTVAMNAELVNGLIDDLLGEGGDE
jgi:hypothetical protein